MRNLLIILAASIIGLASCAPNMEPPKDVVETTIYDTVATTLDTSSDLTTAPIVVRIFDNKVVIESPNVNTTYTVDMDKVIINRTEVGTVEYLQVNNDILFKENKYNGVNHTYKYLENNTLEVIRGNTIDGIIADHAKEFGLTKKSFYRCNTFLKQRGLQIGDRILLNCD